MYDGLHWEAKQNINFKCIQVQEYQSYLYIKFLHDKYSGIINFNFIIYNYTYLKHKLRCIAVIAYIA